MSPRVAAAFNRTFSSVRDSRNFRLYLTGLFVSATGTWINFTASSWLILKLTGSGTALGVNSALAFGPVLLLGAWGGVLADRFEKRRILMWTQTSYAVVSLVLAGLIFTDVVELWMVYVMSALAGVVTAIDNPARQSFYIEMVGEQALTNAVSLNSATFTGSRVIGPALAGILIATVGMAACFLIDGLSYLAVLGALLAMRPDELHPQKRTSRQRGHLMAGLRYAWTTDDLRRPLIILAVMFTLVFQWQIVIPLLAEHVFHTGPREFGWLSASAGVGAFVGAIVMAHGAKHPSMRMLGVYAVSVGLFTAVVGLAPTLWVAMIALVPVGFAAMSFMITGNTMLQLTSRPEARGRIMALYGVVFLGSTPIGAPLVGWLGEHFGARTDFFLTGGISIVVGVTILLARRWAAARTVAPPDTAEVSDVPSPSLPVPPAPA